MLMIALTAYYELHLMFILGILLRYSSDSVKSSRKLLQLFRHFKPRVNWSTARHGSINYKRYCFQTNVNIVLLIRGNNSCGPYEI